MIRNLLSRPTVLRYLGLFGSVCCAVDAFLHGAFPVIGPRLSILGVLGLPYGWLIMLLWVVGLTSLGVAWWYGRELVGRGLLSNRWVLSTAVLWMLPMLFIPPLGSRDMYAYACQGALFNAGFSPYLDSVSTQPCPWLETVSPVWRTTPTPYGPVFIVLAGIGAKLGSLTAALVGFRVLAVVGVAAIAACLPVLARRVGVPVDRALWLVLCCPLVPVHLIGGGHNDAVTVPLLVAGLAILAGRRPGTGRLLAGGAVLGLSIATKTTLGVVLPFAALLAAGGPALFPGGRRLPDRTDLSLLVRCGTAVIGAALGTLTALSFAAGLGLGWATSLSGAGAAVTWTSPSTSVGLAVNEVGKWFGLHPNAVPVTRGIALVILPIALLVILWHSRLHDPLYGAGLACVTLIFLAPITQPWYLLWPLTLFAATAVRARWLAATVVLSMYTVLPTGNGSLAALQLPLAFLMTGLVGWVLWRSVSWVRGFAPTEWVPVPLPRAATAEPDRVPADRGGLRLEP